jgi:DNA-directed RNA polymerase subunit beta
MLVAFMPWNGYNFEDSILISERVVAEDRYTSIHIEELVVMARDTKLGSEEITRDIPNLSEQQLARLDESGIVYIGAEVNAGRRAGRQGHAQGRDHADAGREAAARDLRREGVGREGHLLRVDQGTNGTVIDVQVFTREGIQRDKRAQQIIDDELKRFRLDLNDQLRIVEADAFDRIEKLLNGKTANGGPQKIAKGTVIDKAYLASGREVPLVRHPPADDDVANQLEHQEQPGADAPQLRPGLRREAQEADAGRRAARRRAEDGQGVPGRQAPPAAWRQDGRPPRQQGRGLQDRAGRRHALHGRRHPCDIVLNPLGVPSRMNVGQVLEVHLGWAGKGIGQRIGDMLQQRGRASPSCASSSTSCTTKSGGKTENIDALSDADVIEMAGNLSKGVPFATPVFDGAKEEEIRAMLKLAYPDDIAARKGLTATRTQATCMTAAPVRPSSARSPWATCTCSSCTTWWTTRCTPVPPARTAWSPSSRWAARRSSAASASARWKCGRWKPTAPVVRAAGDADREVRRRERPHQGVREHRQGRARHRRRHAGIVQRAGQGDSLLGIDIELERNSRKRRKA